MDDGHIRHLPVAPIEPRPQMVLQRLEAMPPPALAAANSPPSHVRSPAPSSCSAGSPGLSPTHRPQQQQQQQRPTTPGRTTPLLDMRAVAKPIDMEQLHQLPPDMLELYRSVQEIMVYQSAFVPIEGDRFSSVIPARRPAILGSSSRRFSNPKLAGLDFAELRILRRLVACGLKTARWTGSFNDRKQQQQTTQYCACPPASQ